MSTNLPVLPKKVGGTRSVQGAAVVVLPKGVGFDDRGSLKIPLDRLKNEEEILRAAAEVVMRLRADPGTKVNDGRFLFVPKPNNEKSGNKIADDHLVLESGNFEALTNCSLCTAAGLAKRLGKSANTASKVAQSLGFQVDPATYYPASYFADYEKAAVDPSFKPKTFDFTNPKEKQKHADENHEFVIKGLMRWCNNYLGVAVVKCLGTSAVPLPLKSALSRMRECGKGSIFAVGLDGPGSAHWIYAETSPNEGELVFVDFQTDRVEALEASSPTVSLFPLAPNGKTIDYEGKDGASWKAVVVALPGVITSKESSDFAKIPRKGLEPKGLETSEEDPFEGFEYTRPPDE